MHHVDVKSLIEGDTLNCAVMHVLQLPFKVDIIKHPREVDGKSTAVHAAILAPHDVMVYQFPDIPDYTNLSKVSQCIEFPLHFQ